jgi:DNA-directed RNA polymerase I and III subunit RPAC1
MHAVLGIAKDHAKFSPVSTASYRLLPHIDIKGPIPPAEIDHFIKCFSPGVIEDYYEDGVRKVRVKDARKDTVSREVLRHAKFEGLVELGRVRDHFICASRLSLHSGLIFSLVREQTLTFRGAFIDNIESTGMYQPEDLLPEAIEVLLGKIEAVEGCLKELEGGLVGAAQVE